MRTRVDQASKTEDITPVVSRHYHTAQVLGQLCVGQLRKWQLLWGETCTFIFLLFPVGYSESGDTLCIDLNTRFQGAEVFIEPVRRDVRTSYDVNLRHKNINYVILGPSSQL